MFNRSKNKQTADTANPPTATTASIIATMTIVKIPATAIAAMSFTTVTRSTAAIAEAHTSTMTAKNAAKGATTMCFTTRWHCPCSRLGNNAPKLSMHLSKHFAILPSIGLAGWFLTSWLVGWLVGF